MTSSMVKVSIEKFKNEVEIAGKYGRGLEYINKKIGCPARFYNAMPDEMDKKLKDWFIKSGGTGSLYLHGGIGVGKTYSIHALSKLLYVNGKNIEYYNIIELLNKIKSYFDKDNSQENIKLILQSSNSILILDDLGVEKVTDWTIETMYRLINYRNEEELQTIFISNLTLKSLLDSYGDRTVSRITEMVGQSGIIQMTGNDRRLNQGRLL